MEGEKLIKAIIECSNAFKKLKLALIRAGCVTKSRLPRKIKKKIKKEAERAVFELQFEVF